MTYKPPKVVAKSAAKRTFVAGCPEKGYLDYCTRLNVLCAVGKLK